MLDVQDKGGGDTRNAEREGQKGGISTRLATIEYILGNTQKKNKVGVEESGKRGYYNKVNKEEQWTSTDMAYNL